MGREGRREVERGCEECEGESCSMIGLSRPGSGKDIQSVQI